MVKRRDLTLYVARVKKTIILVTYRSSLAVGRLFTRNNRGDHEFLGSDIWFAGCHIRMRSQFFQRPYSETDVSGRQQYASVCLRCFYRIRGVDQSVFGEAASERGADRGRDGHRIGGLPDSRLWLDANVYVVVDHAGPLPADGGIMA